MERSDKMDQELIRKAAEAIRKEVVVQLVESDYDEDCHPLDGIRPLTDDSTFDRLPDSTRAWLERAAQAVLKVFYEHTRTEKPSRVAW